MEEYKQGYFRLKVETCTFNHFTSQRVKYTFCCTQIQKT